jgi:hypothetical protein
VSQNGHFRHVSLQRQITLNLINNLKKSTMKTLNFELTEEIFSEFALTNDEMICVRGGEIDPTPLPTPPPIRL